jgi:hypothetical protein
MTDPTSGEPTAAQPPAAATPAPPPPPPPPPAPPEGAPIAAGSTRLAGKTRNPWGVWLLSLITLGIYQYYWYYMVNDEVRRYDNQIEVEPGISLIAILFGWIIIVPPIVSFVRTGGRIRQAQQAAGRPEACSGGVGFLLQIFSFGIVYYQSQLNKVWDAHNNPEAGTAV